MNDIDHRVPRPDQAAPERDERIANLAQALTASDERIASLTEAVTERDGRIARLELALADRDAQIAGIYRSNSWRATGPLRAPRRLAALLRARAIRHLAGNANLAIYAAIRGRGLAGFLRRLPHYLRHYRTYEALLVSPPPAADGATFSVEAPAPRRIRLHPDLAGIGDPLDASISVVIPTLNAGLEFGWLLRKLRAQRGLREIEIVIVDSGSRDGTVERAQAAGCKVVAIPPADFSHSGARNIGADASRGDYLLFMVQDAYPIGDHWAYGMLRYLLDHADERLAAASCAEYSRSDSDMMYDSMIKTHHHFLGCCDYDRIGEHRGHDHMSLRAYGQLSNVACLIPRDIFARYRYRGDYAEDLDLGIRLIKDGYRVAMLTSVKVVHSHNRPAFYYLKRSFVDVIFLVGQFEDFVCPQIESAGGLIAGIASVAAHLSDWLALFDEAGADRVVSEELRTCVRAWRSGFVELRRGEPSRLGDTKLDGYVDALAGRYLPRGGVSLNDEAQHEAKRFLEGFLARLEHFSVFAGEVYGAQDASLRRQLRDAVVKIFAASAGSALGFMCTGSAQAEGNERDMAETIKNELRAGV